MREIKFRAYLKDEKKIVDIISINFARQMILFYDKLYKMYRCRKFKDFELMQFTGLKDKNGNEIYEGDILNMHLGCEQMDINEYDVICQVVYGFRGKGSEIGFTGETKAGFQIPLASQCCLQVIGNIYENPELI